LIIVSVYVSRKVYLTIHILNKRNRQRDLGEEVMEYIYAAMLLHNAGKPIDEKSVTKVLSAAGLNVDASRVKALIASLSEVDIDEAIKSAAFMPAAAPAAVAEPAEEKPAKEEKKEEEKEKKEEEALEGLGALFG
jgi:large subunit ribosomal protein L12